MATSHSYAPWLILGVITFVTDIIWLAIDLEFRREARAKNSITEFEARDSKTKKQTLSQGLQRF
jgi:hypothetical protein